MVDAECPSATRLAICGHSDERGTVDGAWWPPDYELRAALLDLIAVMGRWIGPVRRVLYDASVFPAAPSRVIRGGSAISVERYTLVATDTVYLMGTHRRNALLWVLPPETPSVDARRLLTTVADAPHPLTVRRLRAIVGGDPATRSKLG